MTQWVRALDALQGDHGSSPSTRMAAHNHLQPQFQGTQNSLFLPPQTLGMHIVNMWVNTYTPKIKMKIKNLSKKEFTEVHFM